MSIIRPIMFELALFPLNTVLFPGMPLSLHIFEDRYKEMIAWCLEMDQPFGVTLIRKGQEALGPLADPYNIGCTARVQEIERLPEGRMNLVVLGENRFRILSISREKPYLVGKVELFPLEDDGVSSLNSNVERLRPWVKRYMQILAEMSEVKLDPQQLPRDPHVLAYLAAVLLQVPPTQKQDLLAVEGVAEMLDDMHAMYRREVALLQAMLAGSPGGNGKGHSRN
jgi:uncharacterized protein